jgi:hypothetical protein
MISFRRHRRPHLPVPTGAHHRIPVDQVDTRPFRKPAEASGTVKVIPQAPAVPAVPAVPEVPVLSAPVPEVPAVPARSAAVPVPLVTEVWLNRNILVGLRRDYAPDGLPVFRAAVGDRYQLHQLAMRGPRTITNGGTP